MENQERLHGGHETLNKPRPGDFCLVCGANPAVIGVFVPEKPTAWRAAKDKSRFIRYCLCGECVKKPDIQATVEKIIRAELEGASIENLS